MSQGDNMMNSRPIGLPVPSGIARSERSNIITNTHAEANTPHTQGRAFHSRSSNAIPFRRLHVTAKAASVAAGKWRAMTLMH